MTWLMSMLPPVGTGWVASSRTLSIEAPATSAAPVPLKRSVLLPASAVTMKVLVCIAVPVSLIVAMSALFHQTSKLPLAPVVRLAWSNLSSRSSPAVRSPTVWLMSMLPPRITGSVAWTLTLSIEAPTLSAVPVPLKRSTLFPATAAT